MISVCFVYNFKYVCLNTSKSNQYTHRDRLHNERFQVWIFLAKFFDERSKRNKTTNKKPDFSKIDFKSHNWCLIIIRKTYNNNKNPRNQKKPVRLVVTQNCVDANEERKSNRHSTIDIDQ